MPAERYYHPSDLSKGCTVCVEDQEFHHLIHVMRARVDDPIEIVNGDGLLAKGIVSAIEKKRAIIDIKEVEEVPKPNYNLILAQAVPRINRLETILEKATELGATEIWLFASKLSERKNFTDHQIDRLKGITIAAMKQCGRLHLPKLVIAGSIKELPKLPSVNFFGDVSSGNIPSLANSWNKEMNDIGIFIGPESGFQEEEEKLLKSMGVKGVTLHPNILRTDTAAIASLSILSHLMLA